LETTSLLPEGLAIAQHEPRALRLECLRATISAIRGLGEPNQRVAEDDYHQRLYQTEKKPLAGDLRSSEYQPEGNRFRNEEKKMITRLQVKNYRSLADVCVELDALTVLVGPNGSGKSTLVDVLWFVLDALRLGLDSAIAKRLGINALRRWSATNALADIEIGLEIKTAAFCAQYAFVLGSQSEGEYHLKAECCTIREGSDETGFKIKEQEWINRPANIGLPALQSTALLLPLIAGIPPYKEIYEFLTGMSFYNIFPEQLKEHQKLANSYPLEEDGQNLASVLRLLKRKKSSYNFTSALQYVIPHVDDYRVSPSGRLQMIQLRHGTPDGAWFELGQESDGILRMLAILTALYQQPPRTLIALEEPELNIHPTRMAKLWEEIVSATKHSQILITTHSPDLLDLCQAEQLRVVENMNGISLVGPLETAQKEIIQAKLFALGQLLQAQGLYRAE
jgi:predicted ATPase